MPWVRAWRSSRCGLQCWSSTITALTRHVPYLLVWCPQHGDQPTRARPPDPPPKTCRPPAVRTVEGLQVWGVQQPRRWETTGSEMAVGGTVALSGYRLPSPEPGTAG